MDAIEIKIENLLIPQQPKLRDFSNANAGITPDPPLTLTNKSFLSYKSRLNTLMRITNNTLAWIMQHPKETLLEAKRQVSDNNSTMSSFAAVVCKLFRVHPESMVAWKQSFLIWQRYLKHYRQKELEVVNKNQLSEKQKEKYVSWQQVQDEFNKMKDSLEIKTNLKSHMAYILFAMLLNIKPKRADLGNVKIFRNLAHAKAYPGNCIYLNTSSQKQVTTNKQQTQPSKQQPSILFIKQYKTVKKNGIIEEELTLEIVNIISKSLQTFPRDHLIVSRVTNLPYENNNAYSKFVNRVFEHYFGKAMGISLWRNIYIHNKIDFNKVSNEELEEIAHLIGHSASEMFKTYRKIAW